MKSETGLANVMSLCLLSEKKGIVCGLGYYLKSQLCTTERRDWVCLD